jgi:shikimate kinase
MGNRSGSLPHTSLPVQQSSPAIRVIFLVGFMGAGKTTVGKELARQLGWAFEDLDDRIQSREGRTIEEIFQNSGEAEFRRQEHMALLELLPLVESSPRVVALGGGAFAQAENAAVLNSAPGKTVFLSAPVEELYRRCQQQQIKRPLQQDATQFRKLYEARYSLYLKATHQIETAGKDATAVAAEVIRTLELNKVRGVI